jgi:hypothetical protein
MTTPLDPSQDPDRFVAGPEERGPLDLSKDPDRFQPEEEVPTRRGRGETLTELIGDGAYEDKRDNVTWLIGLAGVIGFLVLVSLLLQWR